MGYLLIMSLANTRHEMYLETESNYHVGYSLAPHRVQNDSDEFQPEGQKTGEQKEKSLQSNNDLAPSRTEVPDIT